jgi:hypothetical protein
MGMMDAPETQSGVNTVVEKLKHLYIGKVPNTGETSGKWKTFTRNDFTPF